jgi:hypothetical protein
MSPPLKQRLARWLLMMRDRGDDDTLGITQDLLAEMLGGSPTNDHEGDPGVGTRRFDKLWSKRGHDPQSSQAHGSVVRMLPAGPRANLGAPAQNVHRLERATLSLLVIYITDSSS